MSIWEGLGQGFTGVAVGGRACGPACHQIRRTFERFRACGALRSSVSHIEWLRGDGTFVGFQGTLVLCIQSVLSGPMTMHPRCPGGVPWVADYH